MIFAPQNYLNKVKGYSQLMLCGAPKWVVVVFCCCLLFFVVVCCVLLLFVFVLFLLLFIPLNESTYYLLVH